MVNFKAGMMAYLPLGTQEKFLNPELSVPISFVYGDNDWVRNIDWDFAEQCVAINKQKFGDKSNFIILPNSNHNIRITQRIQGA